MSIVAEAPGFLQVFSDGAVKRLVHQTADPSTNISNEYKSKDVTIDHSKPITARIFLPTDSKPPQQQLPVLVYFHGGGFCIGSTTWLGYHVFLGNLSSTAKAIVLSIDYRLAPENKLPIAYDDCFTALEWLGSNSEPWLERADLSRVFLSGDSAGGNIAHQVVIQSVKMNIANVRIKGLLPIHPFFGSTTRTELELAEGSAGEVAMNDMFWKLSLPDGTDRDFYGCNFEKEDDATEWRHFPAVTVFVAGLDFLKERGVMYAEFLKKKGVKSVSLVEAEDEVHVFHAWNPESEATCLLQKQIGSFIQSL
ncbi:probable carboxylesterase 17 [Phtheirospermum japonicum]|uniref:Probable carboxylesterase 17 n=1 Tax=Phtheirospermum japonicum TaxID=374723 RepID=A0A830BQ01_9LAMI|nr:probable carboxylesterase 17 [Phtheirospermum japonicum]